MAHDKTKKSAKSLLKDRSAYAAVTFAIAAVPMVTLVGLTFDASLAYRYKTNLQTAADAATLSMARRSVLNPDIPESELVADAKLLFERHVRGQSVPLPVRYNQMTVDTNKVDAVLKAEVTYNLNFGGLIGMEDIKIPVESRAEFARTNIDFYMLLDNSPSMALGASQNDIDRLEREFGCAFACHTVNAPEYMVTLPGASMPRGYRNISEVPNDTAFHPDYDYNNDGKWTLDWFLIDGRWQRRNEREDFLTSRGIPNIGRWDTYYDAKERGINLRFDAVKEGVDAITERAEELAVNREQFRVGLYRFGAEAWNDGVVEALPPTQNMRTVQRAMDDVEIMLVGGHEHRNTNFRSGINFVREKMEAAASSSARIERDRERVLFIVTDGMQDTREANGDCQGSWHGNPRGNRCFEPIGPELCRAVKDQGMRVAVLYTPYLPMPNDNTWRTFIRPWADQIAIKLRECATPGLYFEADLRTDSIEEAMVTLFDRSVRALRLTPAS